MKYPRGTLPFFLFKGIFELPKEKPEPKNKEDEKHSTSHEQISNI